MDNMKITVGHILNNPNFMFIGDFEITTPNGDDVKTLYDSRKDKADIPFDIINEPVTYMCVNEELGRLRIEIR